ncbi:MAG: hypothetical protein LBG52_03590 [Candidatus Peribacteria bacterium]|jgi:hypothetical protein|nr:hypothetical protein [Candidatus Peribacteria bacterium]
MERVTTPSELSEQATKAAIRNLLTGENYQTFLAHKEQLFKQIQNEMKNKSSREKAFVIKRIRQHDIED